jgi:hypothetical protein
MSVTAYQSLTAIEVYYANNSTRQSDAERLVDNITYTSNRGKRWGIDGALIRYVLMIGSKMYCMKILF